MRYTVAAIQFSPAKTEISANLDRIAALTLEAGEQGVDVAIFPESCVAGYFLQGGVLECSLRPDDLRAQLQQRLVGLKRPIDILVGFYELADDTANVYNSAAYLELGGGEATIRHVYRKFFLPTYGVFDEDRFVSRGHELGVFDTRFGKVGVLICEDVWHSILPTLCSLAGATSLLVPSASPARGFAGETIDNLERYQRMIAAICDEHGVYCINSQLTGFEGGKGFVGGSSIVDPFGKVLAAAPVGEEGIAIAQADTELVALARTKLPMHSDLVSAWGDLKEIAAHIDPPG